MYNEAIKFHKTVGLVFILICLAFCLTGCGEDSVRFADAEPDTCSITPVSNGNVINCGDGDFLIEDGTDGSDGKDGSDGAVGQPGQDAVTLTQTTVPKGSCSEVSPGIYVESIRNGTLFDVYLNDKCADNQGEYCDNVIPSFGRSGRLDPNKHPGSATVCWAGNIQISGSLQSDNSLLIYVLDFN